MASLEQAIDEEMREVLAVLEGREPPKSPQPAVKTTRRRAGSDVRPRKSPHRNMLDALAPGVPRSQSRNTPIPSKESPSLPEDEPPISPPPVSQSSPNVDGPAVSDPATRGSIGSTSSPPASPPVIKHNIDPLSLHQYNLKPSPMPSQPLRALQGGKSKSKGALSVVLGPDGRPSGKPSLSRSPAPHGYDQVGDTPRSHSIDNRSVGKDVDLGTNMTGSGKQFDRRRLSDGALLKSGNKFSSIPTTEPEFESDVDRVQEDYQQDDDDEAVDSSEDEDSDDTDAEDRRGRVRTRIGSGSAGVPGDAEPVNSVLAAAAGEKAGVSTRFDYKSLRNLKITPDNFTPKRRRPQIHPHTSFDQTGASGIPVMIDSDEEQHQTDLNSAQKLTMTLSPIHSTPEAYRCIRQVLRGDYRKYQEEAEQGLRRQRMYLVATDLSEEAAYALEWTIGTVLRDGDTLLAVYAVNEEAGTGENAPSSSVGIGEGAYQMMETAAIVRKLSVTEGLVVPGSSTSKASSDGGRSRSHLRGLSTDQSINRAERERRYATQEISERCIKLLRKTKLQVRIVVEVFHCKSPKHMITEVIDHLEPTLVILGSRGRSAIKGVLLGSFSNYLVTKSSIPVMVARKKLRKHSKLQRTNIRLSNMLQGTEESSRLATAAIEKPSKRY